MALTKITLRFAVSLLLPITLANCAEEPPPPPAKVRHIAAAKTHYQADEFIEHTALAYLKVVGGQPENSGLQADLDILDGFSTQKQKASSQPVVVITYSVKNKKTPQHIIAPFNPNGPDKAALLNIMSALESQHYILQDITAAEVTVGPVRSLKLKERDLKTVKVILEQQLQGWSQELRVYRPLAEAQAQIKLIHFFMERRMKEAAYLSVDNAKQALASGAENGTDPEIEKDLSKQLAQLESQLRVVMPYTAF